MTVLSGGGHVDTHSGWNDRWEDNVWNRKAVWEVRRCGGVTTSPDCSNSDAVWQFDSTEETLILTSDTLKENQRETVQTFNTQDQRSDEREIRRESSELWIYRWYLLTETLPLLVSFNEGVEVEAAGVNPQSCLVSCSWMMLNIRITSGQSAPTGELKQTPVSVKNLQLKWVSAVVYVARTPHINYILSYSH